MTINVFGEELILLPQRVVYLPKSKTLWVADALLGKPTETKTGNVPFEIVDVDVFRLNDILNQYDVKRLVFVGHLFFYAYADKRERPGEWLASQGLEVHWINGHETDSEPMHYAKFNLTIHDGCFTDGPFVFINEYRQGIEEQFKGKYIITANVGPAYKVEDNTEPLPCFYFGAKYAILPSFGMIKNATVLHLQNPSDQFYPIQATQVLGPVTSV